MPEEKKTAEGEKVKFESFLGDKRLMKEIEEKAKSGKKEDIIESLNLFEKKWKILPNGPARDFIYSMRENEDNEIKGKAEEVYSKSLRESDERIKRSLENLTKSFSASFLPLGLQMMELSKAFDISKQMADIAKAIPSIPSAVFDIMRFQPKLNDLMGLQSVLNETVTKQIAAMQKINSYFVLNRGHEFWWITRPWSS